MDSVEVEICVNSDRLRELRPAVAAAYAGGAGTIELCSAMHLDGLTPRRQQIVAARAAFRERKGLMAMIRPRAGDFCYGAREHATMLRQIRMAAECGADGVVFGTLRGDGQIDAAALGELVAASRDRGLATTFHRAVDAVPDQLAALETLIGAGVDRVMASGTPWGRPGGALEGRGQLARLIELAAGRIAVVIGGGVNQGNIPAILAALPPNATRVSFHAYSGAHAAGVTTAAAVRALVDAANPAG
ncbi:MAG TPA: copper homeostasis protein CutC [Herpetosiphonaceae bacterium]|nr:copper homeostasis protein CutC [Herpetosiphonaceae bacterium]